LEEKIMLASISIWSAFLWILNAIKFIVLFILALIWTGATWLTAHGILGWLALIFLLLVIAFNLRGVVQLILSALGIVGTLILTGAGILLWGVKGGFEM
jgi:hypothetical protein